MFHIDVWFVKIGLDIAVAGFGNNRKKETLLNVPMVIPGPFRKQPRVSSLDLLIQHRRGREIPKRPEILHANFNLPRNRRI